MIIGLTNGRYIQIPDNDLDISNFLIFGDNLIAYVTEPISQRRSGNDVELNLFKLSNDFELLEVFQTKLPPLELIRASGFAVMEDYISTLCTGGWECYDLTYCNYRKADITKYVLAPDVLAKYRLEYVFDGLEPLHNSPVGFLSCSNRGGLSHVLTCTYQGMHYYSYPYGFPELKLPRSRSYLIPLPRAFSSFNDPFYYDACTNTFGMIFATCPEFPRGELFWTYISYNPATGTWVGSETTGPMMFNDPPGFEEFLLCRKRSPGLNYLAGRDIVYGIIYLPDSCLLVFFKFNKRLNEVWYNTFRHSSYEIPILSHYKYHFCNFFIIAYGRAYYAVPGPNFVLKGYHGKQPFILHPALMQTLLDIPLPFKAVFNERSIQEPNNHIRIDPVQSAP